MVIHVLAEFVLFRVVFLVVGMAMMGTAHTLSESVVFYYGGAMTIGIILVILMILFQVLVHPLALFLGFRLRFTVIIQFS